jgi:hypothetical protein
MAISIIGKQIPSQISGKFQFQKSATVLRNTSDIREMRQVTGPELAYEFYFPPTNFSHSGYGPTFNEINRPYSTPIVDITSGKAERCSFEFLVAPPKRINTLTGEDGKPSSQTYQDFYESIDDQLRFIQTIADFAIPVEFINVHPALAIPKWYIDECTINHGRQNLQANTTSATVSLSLIEFIPRRKTMILLPRFKHGKFVPAGKKKTVTDPPPGKDDVVAATAAYKAALASGDQKAIYYAKLELADAKANLFTERSGR